MMRTILTIVGLTFAVIWVIACLNGIVVWHF